MTPTAPDRLIAPVAGLLGFVLLAGIVTASYRLGVRDSGLPAEFDVLAQIYARVHAEAVKEPDDAALAEGAAVGMLAGLDDPYASYFDAEGFGRFSELLEGSFTGVGLLLEEAPGGVLQVVKVIEGGPAEAAQVEVGERIVSVDGQPMANLPAEEVVRRVRGPEGTAVRVGFEGGSKGPRELQLTRARVELPVIEHRLLPDGVGVIELMEFPEDAGERVRAAVQDLVGQGARGIVLDLRGNPGGLLTEAVSVASVFVEDGPIVQVKERDQPLRAYEAEGKAYGQIPLVVLIDKGTASASEIVAQAVKTHARGRVVGVTSFGKGTVQVVRPLEGGAGVKFTIAEYLGPKGEAIEGKGVAPDVAAEGTAEEQLAAARREALAAAAAQPAAQPAAPAG